MIERDTSFSFNQNKLTHDDKGISRMVSRILCLAVLCLSIARCGSDADQNQIDGMDINHNPNPQQVSGPVAGADTRSGSQFKGNVTLTSSVASYLNGQGANGFDQTINCAKFFQSGSTLTLDFYASSCSSATSGDFRFSVPVVATMDGVTYVGRKTSGNALLPVLKFQLTNGAGYRMLQLCNDSYANYCSVGVSPTKRYLDIH